MVCSHQGWPTVVPLARPAMSNFCFHCPLVFSSLGQSAIFLIGGHSRQQRPLPLLLQSGDVVVMAGKSRMAYHAVPHILPCEGEPIPTCLSVRTLKQAIREAAGISSCQCRVCGCVLDKHSDSSDSSVEAKDASEKIRTGNFTCGCLQLEHSWPEFEDYLRCSRININIRQVGDLT